MDWQPLRDFLINAGLPVLGASLGGPAGMAIGKALAASVGSASDAPADILAHLTANTDAVRKAKEFEANYSSGILQTMISATAGDIADARGLAAKEIAKSNPAAASFSSLIRPLAGFTAIVSVAYSVGVHQDLTPAVSGIVGTIIEFYFGGRVIEKVMPHVSQMVSNFSGNSKS